MQILLRPLELRLHVYILQSIIRFVMGLYYPPCESSLTAEPQPSKLLVRVRLPSFALAQGQDISLNHSGSVNPVPGGRIERPTPFDLPLNGHILTLPAGLAVSLSGKRKPKLPSEWRGDASVALTEPRLLMKEAPGRRIRVRPYGHEDAKKVSAGEIRHSADARAGEMIAGGAIPSIGFG